MARRAQTGLDERERRDDNGLGDVLLWAAVQGPGRGQQSPLSGRGAEALRGVRDRRERRMPDPQGAGELLRLGSSVGGDRKTDRAELPMRPAQRVSGPRLELRVARCLDSTSRRLGETHSQLRIVAPMPNARGRRGRAGAGSSCYDGIEEAHPCDGSLSSWRSCPRRPELRPRVRGYPGADGSGPDRELDRGQYNPGREVVPYANDHRSTMDRRYSTEQQRIILAIYKSALELERATAAEMSRETAMMRESLAETR